jgi:hypothetical protein
VNFSHERAELTSALRGFLGPEGPIFHVTLNYSHSA